MKKKVSTGFFVLSALPWVGFGIYVVLVTAVDGFSSAFGPEGDRLAISLSFVLAIVLSGLLAAISWRLNGAKLRALAPLILCVMALASTQMIAAFWYTKAIPDYNESEAGLCTNAETIFFGGSGMRGAYVRDMVVALKEGGWPKPCGASHKVWSKGSIISDALSTLTFDLDTEGNTSDARQYTKAKHFIGYSYGGLQAAQMALDLSTSIKRPVSLTLVATPIGADDLDTLKTTPAIKPLRIINLDENKDPIRAGRGLMNILSSAPILAWQFFGGSASTQWGHFHLTDAGSKGAENRRLFVQSLRRPGNAHE